MVILVVFNSFNVVKNLKKPDRVAHQMPPFYTTDDNTSYNSDFSLDTAISNVYKLGRLVYRKTYESQRA